MECAKLYLLLINATIIVNLFKIEAISDNINGFLLLVSRCWLLMGVVVIEMGKVWRYLCQPLDGHFAAVLFHAIRASFT